MLKLTAMYHWQTKNRFLSDVSDRALDDMASAGHPRSQCHSPTDFVFLLDLGLLVAVTVFSRLYPMKLVSSTCGVYTLRCCMEGQRSSGDRDEEVRIDSCR